MALLLVVGCAADPGPPGGVRPDLEAVPTTFQPRYDAFERSILAEDLAAAAVAARRSAARADARWDGTASAVETAGTESAVETSLGARDAALTVSPAPAAPPPPTPEVIELDEDLIGADGVVDLAEAVLRDRRELARRAAIRADVAAAAVPAPVEERLTAVVFPATAAALPALEQRRLAAARANVTVPPTAWIVSGGGALFGGRAEAVRDALVELGVDETAIEVRTVERDADVVEIGLRR